ncbi:phosphoesterase, partial [Enterococcus lactis]|nr:phosphoesterase [Enterococcus lactis]
LLKLHKANSQPGIGILSLDNYEHAIDNLKYKKISYLNSLDTILVYYWMNLYHVISTRINAERYLFLAHMNDLNKKRDKK